MLIRLECMPDTIIIYVIYVVAMKGQAKRDVDACANVYTHRCVYTMNAILNYLCAGLHRNTYDFSFSYAMSACARPSV